MSALALFSQQLRQLCGLNRTAEPLRRTSVAEYLCDGPRALAVDGDVRADARRNDYSDECGPGESLIRASHGIARHWPEEGLASQVDALAFDVLVAFTSAYHFVLFDGGNNRHFAVDDGQVCRTCDPQPKPPSVLHARFCCY